MVLYSGSDVPSKSHNAHIIYNEDDDPLFRASDIGKVLGIKKIRNSISDFDEIEKVARTVGTLGGDQEMIYLTEQMAREQHTSGS